MNLRQPKSYSQADAFEKLKAFCAYQERSKRQVVQKMRLLGLDPDWFDGFLEKLELDGYLNNERFAAQFARGKSVGRGWGPLKIRQRLNAELEKPPEIQIGLEHIDIESAQQKLKKALVKKKEELTRKNDPKLKEKLLRFCLSRGFDFGFSIQLLKTEFGI